MLSWKAQYQALPAKGPHFWPRHVAETFADGLGAKG
jgi:hypothetical protein